jgi:hypothetical protein
MNAVLLAEVVVGIILKEVINVFIMSLIQKQNLTTKDSRGNYL